MSRPTRTAYLLGLRDGAPFILVIVPFAMLFGVVATEAGWTLEQIMAMSVLVIAGASQFTAVQMLVEQAPVLIVILTTLAVNLRMAVYSASLSLHLGAAPFWQRAGIAYALLDQTYGTAMARYAIGPEMGLPQKVAYFFGAGTPLIPLWYGFTWVGAVAGGAIPEALALDFAVPITFLAMTGPMLRDRPHVVAAAVAVVVSLAAAGLPYSLGILVAGGVAMLVGAAVEARSDAG